MKKIRKHRNYLHLEGPSLHLHGKIGDFKGIFSPIRTNYPKISALTTASIAREAGLDIEAVDMKIHQQDNLTSYKKFFYGPNELIASRMGMSFDSVAYQIANADILGISINPTCWSDISLDLIRYAKKINKELFVIIGGTDAMFRYEYYLNTGLIDVVIIGEGEESGKILFQQLQRGQLDLDKIPGIAFLNNGKAVATPRGTLVNLDDCPLPAIDIFEAEIPLWTTPIEYWKLPQGATTPIAFIELSRGCVQRCDYCTTPAKLRSFRAKSLSRIEKELDYLLTFGISTINIWDDSISSMLKLNNGEERLKETMNLLRNKGFAWEFSQGAVVFKDLYDEQTGEIKTDLIDALYSSSFNDGKFIGSYAQYCPFEFLQVENPSNAYEKLMTYEKELAVFDAILSAGVSSVSFGTIFGLMEDNDKNLQLTKKRLHEIVDIANKHKTNSLVTSFIYQLFPGTKAYTRGKEKIVYPIDKYPELVQLRMCNHETSFYKPHELVIALKIMEKEFYTEQQFQNTLNTGRYIWS